MQNLRKVFSFKTFTNKLNNKFCFNKNPDYFIPPTRILFQNGKSNIFRYTSYNSVKKGYILLNGLMCFVAFKAVQKLYNYQDRNIFGYIFYGGVALFLVPKLHSLPKVFNKIIANVELMKDGHNVIIQHSKFGFVNTYRTVDIAKISKPVNAQDVLQVQFGFPILLEGELFYLPRDNDAFNQEVLPAVLNGKYIDTGDFEDEINI